MGFDSSNLRFMRSIAGGFNHFELRSHKRGYELPGVFDENDLNPPMESVRTWLEDKFGRVNQ